MDVWAWRGDLTVTAAGPLSRRREDRKMKHTKIWLFAAALIACTGDIPAAEHRGTWDAPTSTIASESNRHDTVGNPGLTLDIYLMDVDENGMPLSDARQLVGTDSDDLPALSPDGKGRIVFDSNRARAAGEPINTSDLFL